MSSTLGKLMSYQGKEAGLQPQLCEVLLVVPGACLILFPLRLTAIRLLLNFTASARACSKRSPADLARTTEKGKGCLEGLEDLQIFQPRPNSPRGALQPRSLILFPFKLTEVRLVY